MNRRILDGSIWSNENFAALSPRGRLLQIGMINLADDQGRMKAHPLYLAKEIFPYDHIEAVDITKWLEEMQEHGTILLYMAAGKQYAQFCNWWQYQSLQFAHPSKYPRPDGWQDSIRFNGKGNQMMVCNWRTPKGDQLDDTCDQDGKSLPFESAKVPTQVDTQVPAQARTQVATKVRTLAPTQAPTEVDTQAPTQVTSQLTTNNLTKEEEGEGERAATPPPPTLAPPSVPESALKPGQHLYRAVCEILGWDYQTLPTKSQVQVADAVRKLMAAAYTCEELERFMGEVWAKDWRWTKKKQRPTLEEFQAEVGKLHAGPAQARRKYSDAYERASADDVARRKEYSAYNDLLPKLPVQP